ncbi:MAG: GIY-YIG nuclease family protein [Firmicutes bacterium]|nr:GIY-YIG nuclease family protein [Bacillota bacterium]
MPEQKTKKELQAQYKEREIIGGVYAIRNTLNNKMLLLAATDLQGSKNRFEFARKTGSCVDLKLQKDWTKQGAGSFAFEVLEELKKGAAQTAKEFKADIDVLKEIWLDKLSDRELY